MIEQTEALVSIDVNGGHRMTGQGQGTSQVKAVLDVNLAAAKQVIKIQFFSPFYTSFYIIGDRGLYILKFIYLTCLAFYMWFFACLCVMLVH